VPTHKHPHYEGHPLASRDAKLRYFKLLIPTLALFVLGIAGGLATDSLALIADAGHVLGDSLGIIVALLAIYAMEYGAAPHKTDRMAGRIITLLIAGGALFILYEATERFVEPQEVSGGWMMFFAVAGVIGNWWQHRIHDQAPGHHRGHTHESLNTHILGDLWQSLAIIISGGIIYLTGWNETDPVLSVGIALWMLWRIRPQSMKTSPRQPP
jgi:cobalt-zinc-cadmium efflux system protein